jgi:CSLREA domain-containing protein
MRIAKRIAIISLVVLIPLLLGLVLWETLAANRSVQYAPSTMITVTTTDDEHNRDNDCSLREAIAAANTDTAVDACSPGGKNDIINFSISGTIVLSSTLGELDIDTNVTVEGGDVITVSGNNAVRVFFVDSGTVTFDRLTISNGIELSLVGGGGIYNNYGNSGMVTVSNSTFYSNSATNGGGIASEGARMIVSNSTLFDNSAGTAGGILNNNGALTVTNSTLFNNSATNGGGVFNQIGTMAVSSSTLSGNSAIWGGGIYNDGTLTVSNSTLYDNVASNHGGSIYNYAGRMMVNNSTLSGNAASDNGGSIYNNKGTMMVNNSTLTDNRARMSGGGIWSEGNLHLGAVHIFSNSATHGGGVYVYDGSATLTGTRVVSNTASSRGGGVYVSRDSATLTVSGGGIESNSAGYSGGGVCVERGSATLTGTRIVSNSALAAGGGVFVPSGSVTLIGTQVLSNSAQAGGGVFVEGSSAVAVLTGAQIVGNLASGRGWGGGGVFVERGRATLVGTQVFRNRATYGDGGGVCARDGSVTLSRAQVVDNSALDGGGVFLGGPSWVSGVDATLDNNIISDNQVTGEGSGVYIENNSSAHMRHNTVARNTGGSGIQVAFNSTVALINTILVSHTVGISVTTDSTAILENTLWGSGAWANDIDLGGTGIIVTGTINLWGDPAFVAPETGDYHIGWGSAAIDKAAESDVVVDIDGDSRPIGPAPDIGADETRGWTRLWTYLPIIMSND